MSTKQDRVHHKTITKSRRTRVQFGLLRIVSLVLVCSIFLAMYIHTLRLPNEVVDIRDKLLVMKVGVSREFLLQNLGLKKKEATIRSLNAKDAYLPIPHYEIWQLSRGYKLHIGYTYDSGTFQYLNSYIVDCEKNDLIGNGKYRSIWSNESHIGFNTVKNGWHGWNGRTVKTGTPNFHR